jgi:predicted alpha/beta hydrolase family esterase
MKQIILIHGSPEPDEVVTTQDEVTPAWFQWLKETLPNVVIPPMPLDIEVVYEEWLKVFEQISLAEDSILVGHSCGGGFVLRYLSEHPEVQFARVVLVAPWIDAHNELSTNFMKFEIDGSISNRIETHVFISSDDSSGILDSMKVIREKLVNAIYHEFTDREHFCGKPEFPELLELLK